MIALNSEMEITRRVDLNLGYNCNLKCRFCYYQLSMASRGSKSKKMLSTTEAKKWLRFFRSKGILSIDLTGGEPTIRNDITELIDYCREIEYQKICLITNGVTLANRQFCQDLVESGLNDVLFSVHGPNSTIHDYQTQTHGSFRALIRGIENMQQLGITCRSNTVVNALSHLHLGQIVSLLHHQGISRVNLILFNPVIEAQHSKPELSVRYQDTVPYLKRILETYQGLFDGITIRYIPFCLMPGYERFITNCPQTQYDPYEWDYYLSSRFRRHILVWLAAIIAGLYLHPSPHRLRQLDLAKVKREAIMWTIIGRSKKKPPQCKECRYFKICDGLWRSYALRAGFKELHPIRGNRISDPTFFMLQNPQFQSQAKAM